MEKGLLADLLRRLGHDTARVAGKSVSGWTALEMAKPGVARSVVALSPSPPHERAKR